MKKRHLYILLALTAALVVVCLFPEVLHPGRRARMQAQLARLQAMNRADSLLTDDSLALALADYFDDHGTPNEQLLAHYLLGRTHADRGEAPAAIAAYHDAISRADTTAQDCDFRLLASVHAQMAWLYHQQLLLSYEIDAHRRASHYDFLAGDTLYALYEQKMVAGAYILQNKMDSAELVIKDAMNKYRYHGYTKEELQTSTMLMYLYVEQPTKLQEVKQLMDRYEASSDYFNDKHGLSSSRRKYYYYKGKYYETINMLDSAEHYYRKVYRPGMSYVEYDPMYRGLLSVFKKLNNADSIAKYAQLYCEVNDSSIAVRDQEVTARMTASYNYSSYQRKSAENAKKANEFQSYVIWLLAAVIICMALVGILLHRHYIIRQEKQRAIERTKAEIASLAREYEGKLAQLQQLERSHERRIGTIQKELGNVRESNKGLLSKNREAEEVIQKLNTQFEEERNNLLHEIGEYASKVDNLERQLKIAEYKKNSVPYFSLGIVVRIKDYYTKDNHKRLTDEEMDLLVKVTNDYFPDMISDLHNAPGISMLGLHVCLLVALNIQPNNITHLLNISSAQVGNLKKDINKALFNENTARTLYKNLSTRYKILSS